MPPIPIDRDRDRRGDRAQLLQRDRAHRRAGEAAAGRRRARPPLRGSSALAFSVLISETASAPPSSAAIATAAGSATLGVSLTISGFSVSGRSASSSASGLGRLLADDQPRLDVGAGDVELQRGDLVALRRRPRPGA